MTLKDNIGFKNSPFTILEPGYQLSPAVEERGRCVRVGEALELSVDLTAQLLGHVLELDPEAAQVATQVGVTQTDPEICQQSEAVCIFLMSSCKRLTPFRTCSPFFWGFCEFCRTSQAIQ